MAHIIRDKQKLLNRVRRIRGQIGAVERALTEEAECSEILHSIAACRGAITAQRKPVARTASATAMRCDRKKAGLLMTNASTAEPPDSVAGVIGRAARG